MVHDNNSDTTKGHKRYEVSLYEDHLIERGIEDESQRDSKKKDSALFYLGYVGQVGFVIAIPIAGGVALGSFLDTKWGTYPKMTLGGLMIGIIISIINFIAVVKEIISGAKK